MNGKNEFRSLVKLWYKDTHYEMFINKYDKVAYLIINDKGEYEYPTLKQLLELNTIIHCNRPEMVQSIIRDDKQKKQKKVKFIPKVIIGGIAVILTANMIGKIGNHNTDARTTHADVAVEQTVETSSHSNSSTDELVDEEINSLIEEYNNAEVQQDTNTQSSSEMENPFADLANQYDTEKPLSENGKPLFTYDPSNYASFLANADDQYDYNWASDYRGSSTYINISDANGYSVFFDYNKPTYNDMCRVIDSNRNISSKYKDFIKEYVNDWLTRWPESDLSVLYYNLQTLKIEELTPEQIQLKALNASTVACYQSANNTIFVRNDIDVTDRTSNDYIVLAHELTHPARTLKVKEDGVNYKFLSYNPEIPYEIGCYYDEAVITNLIYQMQGENNRSTYYTVPCSYYRIIMDCVGYDGNEYMNHSINDLASKMDAYMGDENYAYYIMQLIGYKYQIKMDQYVSVDVPTESYEELYDYITRMYMKKYLTPGMSADEAEAVFSTFANEMAWNIENLQADWEEKDSDIFRPTFEKCCEDLGISLGLSL